MTVKRFVQAAAIMAVALFVMAASANASIIYSTDLSATQFSGGGLVLDSSGGTGGASATLTFVPLGDTTVGTSNISYGDFILTCTNCSTQTEGTADATFSAFTFDLYVDDTSDNAVEEFVGTAQFAEESPIGIVYSDSSNISIAWAPTQIGPGPATGTGSSGDFGTTYFTIFTPTPIVAPSSNGGDTTVQGTSGSSSAVPEPATMALVGSAFIGLAALARKRRRA